MGATLCKEPPAPLFFQIGVPEKSTSNAIKTTNYNIFTFLPCTCYLLRSGNFDPVQESCKHILSDNCDSSVRANNISSITYIRDYSPPFCLIRKFN